MKKLSTVNINNIFIKTSSKNDKTYIKLFNCITLLKICNNAKYTKVYFLGIPVFYKKASLNKTLIINENTRIYAPKSISDITIGKGSYVAENAIISQTDIGKFCSIGPNLVCGYGIHPVNGISTSPCFYSTLKQNGMTFSSTDKIEERKRIHIGNDVFIGMNVSILDGVTIGDGAVIGAGAVVTKDVAPYSIVGGVPAKHIKYRFDQKTRDKLQQIKWWDWPDEKLKNVEKYFFNIGDFFKQKELL